MIFTPGSGSLSMMAWSSAGSLSRIARSESEATSMSEATGFSFSAARLPLLAVVVLATCAGCAGSLSSLPKIRFRNLRIMVGVSKVGQADTMPCGPRTSEMFWRRFRLKSLTLVLHRFSVRRFSEGRSGCGTKGRSPRLARLTRRNFFPSNQARALLAGYDELLASAARR